jgi:hypothetical protein
MWLSNSDDFVSCFLPILQIQYAANVFAKTYEAMIHNNLEQVTSNYCDPYCREITLVSIVEADSSNIFEASARQSNECDTELTLTLQVEGTYWACEGSPFPGLFSDPMADEEMASNTTTSGELVRMINGNEMCQKCLEDSVLDGLIAPSSSDLLEAMEPYVTVLEPICALLSTKVLDDEK